MDSLVRGLAASIGIPADLLRIAVCIVASFPLGSLVKRIPATQAALKDVVIAGIGIFYLTGLFSLYGGVVLMLSTSLITYFLAVLFPSKKWMPWANFIIQMTIMLLAHCREQFAGGDFVNEIGITGSQMILVQKLTAFAWDRFDGTQPEAELSKYQKRTRVVGTPSLLRYFSWVFFFPTVMTGPMCSFREHSEWVEIANRPPRAGKQLVRKMLHGLLWVVLYTQTSGLVPHFDFYKQDFYLRKPLFGRIFLMYVAGLTYRTKYYAAWLLSETACVNCGLGYNGVDEETGEPKWDRMTNVQPLQVEFAQNFYGVFANWNIITSQWLRYYVYIRVTPKGKKPGVRSTFATFLVSALWHGTRPGYYLTFITAAVLQTFGKVYRKSFRPIFVGTPLKRLYDVVTLVVTQAALGFCVIPFILLDLVPAYMAWKSVYFFVLVGVVISWLTLTGPLAPAVKPVLRSLYHQKTE